ncbi:kynureninase [Actinocrispum sp. NPDC049592]|uniref:kynureninase n=1 Tax=Actinocrispum sp. NPDC049592 TaxID=3154835 RepID=UPI003426F925
MSTSAQVESLDAADPLAACRAAFALPDNVIYLAGNSLGPLPVAAKARVAEVVAGEWGNGLVGSWNKAGWFDKPRTVGELVAPLIGAAPGQVVVCDTTSINLYKVLMAAVAMRPGRKVIVAEADAFPTDLYMTEGALASLPGYQRRLIGDLEPALGPDVAAVVLSHVDYKTSAVADLAEATRRVHRSGALVIWDLCHSVGALPVRLDEAEADFAVGCTYKYLNGGPGAPAFVYVAQRHHEAATHPLSGWHGHQAPFDFETNYVPAPGIDRFRSSTPHVLSYAPLEASLRLWQDVDLDQLRAKSMALSKLFLSLADKDFEIVGPRDPARRGSHIALRHEHGYGIIRALIDRGIIGDFRAPDILRFGLSPLYTRYIDVWNTVQALKEVLATQAWTNPAYQTRATVT